MSLTSPDVDACDTTRGTHCPLESNCIGGVRFQVFYNEERWKDAVPMYKEALKVLKEKLGEKDENYLRVRSMRLHECQKYPSHK